MSPFIVQLLLAEFRYLLWTDYFLLFIYVFVLDDCVFMHSECSVFPYPLIGSNMVDFSNSFAPVETGTVLLRICYHYRAFCTLKQRWWVCWSVANICWVKEKKDWCFSALGLMITGLYLRKPHTEPLAWKYETHGWVETTPWSTSARCLKIFRRHQSFTCLREA